MLTTTDLGIISNTQNFSGAITSGETTPSTADVFLFRSPASSALRYRVGLSGMSGNLDLAVGSVTSSNPGTSFENVVTGVISSGGQVVVTVLSVGNALSNYTLTISASPDSDDVITNASPLPALTVAQPTFDASGAASSSDPQSYYRFDLAAPADFRVNLSRLSNNLDLELLNAAGMPIRSSTAAGNSLEDIQFPALSAGRYYLRVFGAVNTQFDLTGTINPAADDLIATARNLGTLDATTLPTVRTIGAVGGVADLQDYYRVNVTAANTTLRAEINNRNDRVVALQDANGRVLAASTVRGTGFQTVTATGLAVGTYYVQVFPFDPATTGNYELAVSVGSDDLLGTATSLGTVDRDNQPKITAAGTVGGPADIQDYFKFAISELATVDLNLSGQTTSMQFEILNSVGRAVLAPAASSSPVSVTTDLAIGTYYMRVFSASGSSSNYNLQLARRIPRGALEELIVEPNRSSFRAVKLNGTTAEQFWGFTLTQATTVEANMLTLTGTTNLNLQLLDDVGRVIAMSAGGSTSIERISASLQPGFYVFRVYAIGGIANSYELSLAPMVGSDDLVTSAINLGALDTTALPTIRVTGTAGLLSDNQDTYRFTLNQNTPVRVNLSGLSSNLDFQVYDATGRSRAQSSVVGTALDNAGISTLAAGDYFVRVFAPTPGVSTAYDLTLTTATTSDDTIVGAVGLVPLRPSTAPTLRVSQTSGGSTDIQDYYRFFMTGASDLAINLSGLLADFDVELLDQDGRVFQPTSGTPASGIAIESLVYTGLASATYVVRVFGKPSAVIGLAATSNYDLTISASTLGDDLITNATPLGTLNSSTLPTVATSGSIFNTRDPQDYFKFSLSTAAVAQLSLSGLTDDIDLELLDASGKSLAAGTNAGVAIESISRSLTAGDYFVRVFATVSTAALPYDLAITVAGASDDIITQATDLGTLNPSTRPTVFRSDRAGSTVDLQDMYRFTLDVDSPLRLTLSGLTQNLDARILDSSGRVLVTAALTLAQIDNISLATLVAGTYYVRISGEVLPTSGTYDLAITTSATNDDVLPRATNLGTLYPSLPTIQRSSFAGGVLDPHDYFKFVILSPSSVRISLSGMTADLNVQLLDSLGVTINTANKPGSTIENILSAELIQGLYYIRVHGTSFQSVYNMGVSIATTSDDLITSATPLGTLTAARPTVTTSGTVGGLVDMQDFHTFVLGAPSTLRVNLSGMTSDLNFELMSSVGRVLNVASTTGTAIENLLRANLTAGTYYVRVFAPNTVTTDISYVLTASVAPDSDDLISNAPFLGSLDPVTSPTIRQSGRAGGASDSQDYYRFTLNSLSNFRLNLSGLTDDLDVQLLNSAGVTVASAAIGGTRIENNLQINLAAGSYFVRVLAGSLFTTDSNYDLGLSLLTFSDDLIRTPTSLGTLDPNTLTSAYFTGAVGGPSDIQDYLSFTTNTVSDIRVSLGNFRTDFDVELLDGDGRVVGTSANGGITMENIVATGMAAGTYYVRVFSYDVPGIAGPYDLGVTANAASDDLITNATSLGAIDAVTLPTVRVSGNLTANVDVRDYYSFTVAESTTVRINLSGMTQDLSVTLLDAFGYPLAGRRNVDPSIENTSMAIAPGVYIIAVQLFNGPSSPYDLTFSFDSFSDDLPSNAIGLVPLDLVDHPTVEVDGSTGSVADRQDYYQFLLNAVSNLRINLSGLNADLDVELLDSAGRVIASGVQGGNTIDEIIATNLPIGFYYVRVYSFFRVASTYDLAITTDINSDNTILGAVDGGLLTPSLDPLFFEFQTAGAVGGSDFQDFYKLSTSVVSIISVFTFSDTRGLKLWIYDSFGHVLSSPEVGEVLDPYASLFDVPAGTYYVRITSIHPLAPYNLEIGSYDVNIFN